MTPFAYLYTAPVKQTTLRLRPGGSQTLFGRSQLYVYMHFLCIYIYIDIAPTPTPSINFGVNPPPTLKQVANNNSYTIYTHHTHQAINNNRKQTHHTSNTIKQFCPIMQHHNTTPDTHHTRSHQPITQQSKRKLVFETQHNQTSVFEAQTSIILSLITSKPLYT